MKKLPLFCLVLTLLAACLPSAQGQSNTQVRFRVSYGSTVLGNIDVELFDQDKPVTVSNFLAYVDSGRFKRTFFHRLIPGFVIQGGGWTTINPYSGSLLQIINPIEKYPAITNEFNVGTLRSNVYGTIAMAKVDGQTNSATSSFFFNLANNSTNLNFQNGGFTVFGQITSGTNLLELFNRLAKQRGIIDTADLSYFAGCQTFVYENIEGQYIPTESTSDLPVSFLGSFCVRYTDVLTVDVSRLTNAPPDTLSPTAVLTSPANLAIIDSPNVTVSGTAKDNGTLASVDVILNHERLTTAPGGANWSTVVTNVQPGTNTLTVVAIDARGNQSKPIFRNFFRREQRTLVRTNVGLGTVVGATNGQIVNLGQNYKFEAKPAAGYVFDRWTGQFGYGGGSRSPFDPTLYAYFLTTADPLVRAEFIPNPFIPNKGSYSGLFYEPGQASNDLSGFVTLAVTDRGSYSGKVTIEGKTLPFTGAFNNSGVSRPEVARNGTNGLRFQLVLDVTNSTGQVTGLVTFASIVSSHAAVLTLDRATFNVKTNPAPRAGSYTLILPGTPGSTTVPPGSSYATVKVDGNGGVTVTAALADGSKFTQKTAMARDHAWPLFGSPYAGKGLVIGWMECVTNDTLTDIRGDYFWRKVPTKGIFYTNGLFLSNSVAGSLFVPPATPTTRVVNIPTGTISFAGGNLAADFANRVTIASNNAVTSTNANKLTLTFNKSTGLMTGTVVPPTGGTARKFGGVVLQRRQIGGYGFFLGTNRSGEVELSGEF